jgi:eukaryotic-like serine/threonine-protein kinase
MDPERWRKIEALYHSAREGGARVLADADPDLRLEVERLLAQDSESGAKLLDQNAEEMVADANPVTTGSRLGPYQIDALLGQGGMGRIFRATDTRLGRAVAIKISNERFSDRFENESRAIAALNHPNICTLHDVGPNYLVMELVDGETLAARLKRGKLSVEQTIRLGAQIAEALAAAHSKGIVHRDLKPANIMLTKSGVKVLDFGLAKSSDDQSLTHTGERMGTPAYMAPEQFEEGKQADARSDIYALGLVLSEMATGTRSDDGKGLPLALEQVVKRCLEKDPDERWQSARDLRWELESSARVSAVPPSHSATFILAGALGLATLLLAGLAFVHFRQQATPPPQPARMTVLLPQGSRPLSLALSPDGRAIALILVKDGKQQIWLRELDALEPIAFEGTDGAANPFWSPDSRSIGFFADSKLKRVDRAGGPIQTLCDALGALGGTWNQNGDILLGGLEGVQRVSALGGAVSDIASTQPEIYPFFLPDGRHFLGTRQAPQGSAQAGVWLSSMDGRNTRQIVPDASNAEVIESNRGSAAGQIIFTRDGVLMGLPFDMKRLEVAGAAFPIAQGIAGSGGPYWLAAASRQGVLAYVSGQRGSWQYAWRDRQGKTLGVIRNAGAVAMISPDGKRLLGDWDSALWVQEFGRGNATRVAFPPQTGFNPVWSPDGRSIAYGRIGTGILQKPANGAGAEKLLLPAKPLAVPKSWSSDGRFILYAQINPETGADLLGFEVGPDPKPFVVAQTPATEDQGQFSPDGHWIAYTSNATGQSEIYVIPFPLSPSGGKWMISRGGGVQPRWRRDGKELFYISPDSKMMAVDVNTRPIFQTDTPRALFQTNIVDTGIRTGPLSWDIAPDGNRFLIITQTPGEASSLTVALNWQGNQTR